MLTSRAGLRRHVKRPPGDLPPIAPMFTEYGYRGDSRRPTHGPREGGAAGMASAGGGQLHGEFYKVTMCKYFMMGECPWGDKCTFAHSESERRTHPVPLPGASDGAMMAGGPGAGMAAAAHPGQGTRCHTACLRVGLLSLSVPLSSLVDGVGALVLVWRRSACTHAFCAASPCEADSASCLPCVSAVVVQWCFRSAGRCRPCFDLCFQTKWASVDTSL